MTSYYHHMPSPSVGGSPPPSSAYGCRAVPTCSPAVSSRCAATPSHGLTLPASRRLSKGTSPFRILTARRCTRYMHTHYTRVRAQTTLEHVHTHMHDAHGHACTHTMLEHAHKSRARVDINAPACTSRANLAAGTYGRTKSSIDYWRLHN